MLRSKPDKAAPRKIAGRDIPPGTKIVTYVSRGMEAMRGFDIFMKAAKKLYERRSDVLFVVVGSDRICYGGDSRFNRELDRLMPQLNETVRSFRALADLLARNPEALIKGRNPKE